MNELIKLTISAQTDTYTSRVVWVFNYLWSFNVVNFDKISKIVKCWVIVANYSNKFGRYSALKLRSLLFSLIIVSCSYNIFVENLWKLHNQLFQYILSTNDLIILHFMEHFIKISMRKANETIDQTLNNESRAHESRAHKIYIR